MIGYLGGRVGALERDTAQRRAIREVINAANGPLGPREILDAARRTVPSMGIATVYRNLKALLQSGWLHVVEAPGEAQRYERAGKEHHHHFSCRSCGRMFEVAGCPEGLTEIVPDGFTLEHHEFFFYGHCEDCTDEG